MVRHAVIVTMLIAAACSHARAQPLTGEQAAAELERLVLAYVRGEREPDDLAAVDAFLDEQGPIHGSDTAYLLCQARVLGWIDRHDEARAAFARVPDHELSAPADLSNRLSRRWYTDPEAALALADRLGDADPAALAERVHDSFAQAFCPVAKPPAPDRRGPESLALCLERGAASTVEICRPLGAWIEAARTPREAERIENLAAPIRADPESRGARYVLLICAHLADAPGGVAAARRRVEVLIAELEPLAGHAPSDASREALMTRARVRYWLATAYAQLAAIDSRAGREQSRITRLRDAASWSSDVQDRGAHTAVYYERVTLGTPAEYRTAHARALEHAGRADDAIAAWDWATQHDPEALADARAAFERLRPGDDFDTHRERTIATHRRDVPDFELPLVAGGVLTTDALRGRWTLIDFWGTWCVPCRADMPRLVSFADELRTNHAESAQVVSIAVRDNPDAVRRYLVQEGYDLPVAMDEAGVAAAFGMRGVPHKVLVTPDLAWYPLPISASDWVAAAREHMLDKD